MHGIQQEIPTPTVLCSYKTEPIHLQTDWPFLMSPPSQEDDMQGTRQSRYDWSVTSMEPFNGVVSSNELE